MSVATDTAPSTTRRDSDRDDLLHFYCCDENQAFCGKDLTNEPELDTWSEDEECVVCVGIEGATCPLCGEAMVIER